MVRYYISCWGLDVNRMADFHKNVLFDQITTGEFRGVSKIQYRKILQVGALPPSCCLSIVSADSIIIRILDQQLQASYYCFLDIGKLRDKPTLSRLSAFLSLSTLFFLLLPLFCLLSTYHWPENSFFYFGKGQVISSSNQEHSICLA